MKRLYLERVTGITEHLPPLQDDVLTLGAQAGEPIIFRSLEYAVYQLEAELSGDRRGWHPPDDDADEREWVKFRGCVDFALTATFARLERRGACLTITKTGGRLRHLGIEVRSSVSPWRLIWLWLAAARRRAGLAP